MTDTTPMPPPGPATRNDIDGLLGVAVILFLLPAFGLAPGLDQGWPPSVGLVMALVIIGYRVTQALGATPPTDGTMGTLFTRGILTVYPTLIPVLLVGLAMVWADLLLANVSGVEAAPLAVQTAAAALHLTNTVLPGASVDQAADMAPDMAPGMPLAPLWMVAVGVQVAGLWIILAKLALNLTQWAAARSTAERSATSQESDAAAIAEPVRDARALSVAAFLAGVAAIAAAAVLTHQSAVNTSLLSPLWIWPLAFGALLVALDPLYWQHTLLANISREVATVLGACLIGTGVWLSTSPTPGATAANLLLVFGTCVTLFARGAPTLGHVLSNPVMRALGQGAYAAVILHIPILWAVGAFLDPGLAASGTPVALTLGLGVLVNRFWERPIQRAIRAPATAWLATLTGALVVMFLSTLTLAKATGTVITP